ncbi:MAG: DEAD/DEAH box helicase [Treponema sp.]|nr:DEAD/DEAH box helicase [Treponema sp.]
MDSRNELEQLINSPEFAPNIVMNRLLEAQKGEYTPFPKDLDPRIVKALQNKGIDQLYIHQSQVWKQTQAGKNTVVVTPTASGKTLCYNLPCLNALLNDETARCLYLFPTKALSQDQQSELNEITQDNEALNIKIATYDGDTPESLRISARDSGRIIISNPDMLHAGILPNHPKWIKFFSNLKFIVIDEAHAYRGVMGSHVANVIRRLRRIAAFYGSKPQFILCSATIANPAHLAKSLIGLDVELIDKNGAPRGEKRIILYNPPLVDKVQGIRRSVVIESPRWMTALLKIGIKTILFAHSRIRTEVAASYVKDQLKNIYNDNSGIRVESYRGGFLPNERREIEKGLREGTIHGVVSTNALELGIDIGGLDASVVAGFPGSFNSFWQQSGRAGRRGGTSISVFVATNSPIDQYIMNDPQWFFKKSAEEANIDPDNPYILTDHVKCACFELPFTDEELAAEEDIYSENAREALEYLQDAGIVRHTGEKWHWADRSYPAEGVSLRSAGADNVVIIDITEGRNIVIGEMDRPSAKEMIFVNAVYIHRGRQYIVEELDIENRKCHVRETEVNYYTDGVVKTDIKVLTEDEKFNFSSGHGVLSDVLVRSQVTKFKKLRFSDVNESDNKTGSEQNIGYGDINLPEEEIQTRGLILLFPPQTKGGKTLEKMNEKDKGLALNGAGTLIRSIAPLFLLCDPRDLGIAERVKDPHFGVPALYIYDKYPGGTGLTESLADKIDLLLSSVHNALSRCPCDKGCPSCVGPNGNKSASEDLLTAVNM